MSLTKDAVKEALNLFKKTFGESSESYIKVAAPGRVNLIGEHTDYNEGFVLPLAIDRATGLVGSKRFSKDEAKCRIISAQQGEIIEEFELKHLRPGERKWIKYVQGVFAQYKHEIDPNYDVYIAIFSNIPLGGGLSSSASLEVGIATLLEGLFEIQSVSKQEKIMRCVKAEHDFALMPCGVMDQTAVALCEEGSLLLLDCKSQETEAVSFLDHEKFSIVICNSNAPHELTGSEYSDRVKSCKEAVKILNDLLPDRRIGSLRDVAWSEVQDLKGKFPEVVGNCMEHVVKENERVLITVELLRKIHEDESDDLLKELGSTMFASHESLRDLYKVSTEELDVLVEIARETRGVVGSRMTGGGFGGCTISVVKRENENELKSSLEAEYYKTTGKTCTVFSTKLAKGTHYV